MQSMSAEEVESPSLLSLSSSRPRSLVDCLPDADSLSGSVIVVSLLEAKEFVAGFEAKLLSALTNVVSGGMVVSMIAHVSVGVGLRSRSPSPFKVGELTCQA